jgi:nucleoside 2-deoxyribosyltransferase
MRIYIAGKWDERNLVAGYAKQLVANGFEITWPWYEREPPGTTAAVAAEFDVRGVRRADTCLFIFERELAYKGALVELGMAIALDKRILVVGKGGDSCIFAHHPVVEHTSSFEEALSWLKVEKTTPASLGLT